VWIAAEASFAALSDAELMAVPAWIVRHEHLNFRGGMETIVAAILPALFLTSRLRSEQAYLMLRYGKA